VMPRVLTDLRFDFQSPALDVALRRALGKGDV